MGLYDDASLVFLPSAGAGKDTKAYSVKPTDGTGDFTFSRGSNLSATRVGPDGLIEKGRENKFKQSNNFTTTWTTVNLTLSSGEAGYDGTNNAWKFLPSGTPLTHFLYQNVTGGGIVTFSVYAKAAGYPGLFVYSDQSFAGKYFNVQNGTLGEDFGSPIDSSITSVGNGWYRCTVTVPHTSGNFNIFVSPDGVYTYGMNADGVSAVLVQDAQMESGLVATDYIESGASSGLGGLLENEPRFDYSGGATCPSLLLEPSRTNLIEYSEYLDGFSWNAKIGTSFDTNATTSPEGLVNASLLKEDSSNGSHFVYKDFALTNGSTYTISIFAKANGANRNLRLGDGGVGWATDFDSNFDLTAGTATNGGVIKPMGDGWYRCSVTGTTNATSSRLIVYSLLNNSSSYQGDGTSGVYLYGFQMEEGSYPTSYIPNHSGGIETRTYDITDRGANLSYTGDYTLFMEFELTKDAVYLLNSNTSTAYSFFIENDDCYFFLGRTGGDSGSVQFVNKFNWAANLGTNIKMAFYKSGTSSKMFVNGTEYTPSANSLSTGNEVLDWRYLNYSTTANRQEQAYIKQLLEFEEAISDADCIALTT